MKQTGTTYWNNPKTATNESGFDADGVVWSGYDGLLLT